MRASALMFPARALALGLAKELSGEAALTRAEKSSQLCQCCGDPSVKLFTGMSASSAAVGKKELYLEMVERRFKGVNRCC